MKRLLCLVLVVSVCVSLFAFEFVSSSRHFAMGGAGCADTASEVNFFTNPAVVSLYGDSGYGLAVSAGALDSFLKNSNEPFPTDPESYIKFQFIGKNLSAGLGVDFDLKNRVYGEGISYYDCIKRFEFVLNAAGSIGHFSGGLGIYISSLWNRVTIPVTENRALFDFVRECYLSQFERVDESAAINMKAGLLYTRNLLSVGLVFDRIVSYEKSSVVFNWENFVNGISLAAAYNPQLYTNRGRLKPVVFALSIEADNFFDPDNGVMRMGAELGLQLARNHSVSLRLGYYSPLRIFPSGCVTGGVGYRIHNLDFSLDTTIPVSSVSKSERYTIGFSVTSLL